MTAAPAGLFTIEPGMAPARAFVLASWINSYEAQALRDGIRRDVYRAEHAPLAERLMETADLRLALARDGVYLGWSLSRGDVLHYCYVKHQYRHLFGVAQALLAHLPRQIVCSHMTSDFRRYSRRNPPVFNPYLLVTRP